MFAKIAAFEFRYQVKSPLFFSTFAIFFLLAFGAMVSDNVQIGALGNVNINSPHALAQTMVIFSLIAMFIVTAFLATVVVRDFEWRTADIFRSTPVATHDLLLGRFIGAYGVSVLLLVAVPLGTLVGTLMPWPDPERLGPFVLAHYAWPFVIFGMVNLLFLGALAFAFATLTRSMGMTYVAVIGFFLIYGVTGNLINLESHREVAALVDPFGNSAYLLAVRYWTPFELNSQMAPLAGAVLWNRLLWLGVAFAIIAITIVRFRFEPSARASRKRKPEAVTPPPAKKATVPAVRVRTGAGLAWRQFARRTAFETRRIIFGAPFIVLVALALITTISSFPVLGQLFGTDVYPVTRLLTQVMQGTFTLSLLIVAIYAGAELVWRERDAGIHEVIDATPVPGWVFAGSKMIAALAVVAILLATGVLGSVGYQIWTGYTNFEWSLYLTRHMLDYGQIFYVMAVVSVFVQTLSPNKYAGMGVMGLFVVSLFALDGLGFEDPLYQLGGSADTPYSDMNGWGYFGHIALSYGVYWAFVCLLVFVAAHLMWPRGAAERLRLRFRRVPAGLTPAIGTIGVVAIVGVGMAGGYIVYNTRILNEFVTDEDNERLQVAYEETWRKNEDVPQPRIVAIDSAIDLYPSERRYEARGAYVLENRTEGPIDRVFVGFNPATEVRDVRLAGEAPSEVDARFNYFTFDLAAPLAPGARLDLAFETARANRGFKHARNAQGALSGGSATVIGNGSFVYGNDAMPYIGFARGQILSDRNDRRKYGLPEIDRFPDLDDEKAARNSYLSRDSDWVAFRTTVSTEADQIAVAPGYLVREWTEDGRRHFAYEMDAPMQKLIAWLSARYERRAERVEGIDIEVFHHPAHPWNIEKMIDTMEKSLAYFSASFSPYQYRQMRILEFPAFLGNFAQSFPNTIQWSEGLGFIAKLDDPNDIDYVFYVGAHEMAHQWWGHQVSSANVQGQTVLVETLAQYSALMVMEREYGPDLMRRFLKFELDNYLSNRGGEAREELPLYRVENQAYIHYRKGSLVMYALKDYLGEERVNRALAALIDEVAYRYDPYPRSVDLLRHLKAVAGTPDEIALIEDLFERITLFDLKVERSTVIVRPDGRYDLSLTVSARKLEADGEGREEERELDMPIDIGVFAADPDEEGFTAADVLYLEKHRIASGETAFELTVDALPAFVGIDPYVKLIDRNRDDNLKSVDVIAVTGARQ